MQKNILKNKRGSILIWSMFLLLFISFSFIYFSIQIRYQVNKQSDIISNLNNSNFENLSTGSVITLDDGEIYIKKFSDTFQHTLGDNDFDIFNIKTAQGFSISTNGYLRLYYGTQEPIFINSDYIYSTGITGEIKLQSVSGYSKYSITFDDGNEVDFPYNYVKIYKKVGSYNLLKYTKIIQ